MGKNLLASVVVLLLSIQIGFTQNIQLLSNYDFQAARNTNTNDIWGYVDEDGNEYAIVGCATGTSIVDVTDPVNPVEIFWQGGTVSTWRDMKVYNDFAYIVTEAEDGLLIIDLNPLPASTTLPVTFYTGPMGNPWTSAHNIFIDENGIAYIFGANRGNGGAIMLDLNTDPTIPIEVGDFDTYYTHDGYVRGDTAYFANITNIFFTVVDVSDKANPVILGSRITPSQFAHQIWVDSSGIVYLSEEVSDGFISSYDISNISNIELLDQVQSSPGDRITPHNVFTLGNFLITSYYSYGVSIFDISNPNNMVEVGSYDTNPHDLITTNGCWGVYPYLPSGNIIATDVDEGLFILSPTYIQASFLEGTVTNFSSGIPVSNVDVDIVGVTQLDLTDLNGQYTTGIVNAGVLDVIYSKIGYYPDTLSVNLVSGTTVIQDVQLVEIPQYPMYIKVTDQNTGNPIYNANILFDFEFIEHENTTDGLGESSTQLIYQGSYIIEVAKWGFETYCDNLVLDTLNDTLYIQLNEGYQDDFSTDLGWSTYGSASDGHWDRGTPVENTQDGVLIYVPGYGAIDGCNDKAYVTANNNSFSNVNEGSVVLVSPVFDLSSYTDPYVNYYTWFFNAWGPFTPDDSLKISMSDGTIVKLIDFNTDEINNGEWKLSSIRVRDYFTPSTTMQLIVEVRDTGSFENYTEGGFDNFSVTEYYLGLEEQKEESKINFYPNPSEDFINFDYGSEEKMWLTIFDLAGKVVKNNLLLNDQTQVNVQGLDTGIYLLNLRNKFGVIVYTGKLLKL